MEKEQSPFTIHSRESLTDWYHNIFNHDKAAGVTSAYWHEREDQIRAGTIKPYDYPLGRGDYREFKGVFWWFVKFVSCCKEEPNEVIAKIAGEGRPHSEHDYRLMKEWAVAMRDEEPKIMYCPSDLTPEEIGAELAPFVMVAKVMVRDKLVGPNG